MNDSWGWWIFLQQLSICIRRAAIIINEEFFVLFVMSCDVWPWDIHQSSFCLHCVTPWSSWSQTIRTGEQPISVFLYLSVCTEICCQHKLRPITYADPIYSSPWHRVMSRVRQCVLDTRPTLRVLMDLFFFFFGCKPANKTDLGIINLWIWQSVDRHVKIKHPLLFADSWGLGWDLLAFLAAVTLVLSDLLRWQRDRATGKDNVDIWQKTLLPAVMYSDNSMVRWHRISASMMKRWHGRRGNKMEKAREILSESERSEKSSLHQAVQFSQLHFRRVIFAFPSAKVVDSINRSLKFIPVFCYPFVEVSCKAKR